MSNSLQLEPDFTNEKATHLPLDWQRLSHPSKLSALSALTSEGLPQVCSSRFVRSRPLVSAAGLPSRAHPCGYSFHGRRGWMSVHWSLLAYFRFLIQTHEYRVDVLAWRCGAGPFVSIVCYVSPAFDRNALLFN